MLAVCTFPALFMPVLLFTCSSAQTVSIIGTFFGLENNNSSAFPSSNTVPDFNISKNKIFLNDFN